MITIRPAREVDLPGVAVVLQDAFADKMRVIFGNHPAKIRAVLEAIYTGPVRRGYDGVLVAELDGRIVGTLLIEPMNFTPQESQQFERIAVREFGVPRMLRAAFMLWLIGHRPGPRDAYISDLGVLTEYRGEGVGRRLMEAAERWAYEHERARLTLWVAANNDPAYNLYETCGFTVDETRSSWLTRLAYGIRYWHFMKKSLTPFSLVRYGETG